MFPLNDEQYECCQIAEVTRKAEGWSLRFVDYVCLFCPGTSDQGEPVRPEVGMTARLYGAGFGVRGLYLNNQRVYYRTEAEEDQRHQDWCAEDKRRKREQFENNRVELDQKVASLPEIFQRRIQKFRANNPEFRYEYEPYEVFCCEQAVLFARKFSTPKRLEDFTKMIWEEQISYFNDEEKEAFKSHSGNTFGMSARLAYHYLVNPIS